MVNSEVVPVFGYAFFSEAAILLAVAIAIFALVVAIGERR